VLRSLERPADMTMQLADVRSFRIPSDYLSKFARSGPYMAREPLGRVPASAVQGSYSLLSDTGITPVTSPVSGMLGGSMALAAPLLAWAQLAASVRRSLLIWLAVVIHLVTRSGCRCSLFMTLGATALKFADF
jgi:hypothetical protein